VFGVDWRMGQTDFERGSRPARIDLGEVCVALEASFTGLVASLVLMSPKSRRVVLSRAKFRVPHVNGTDAWSELRS